MFLLVSKFKMIGMLLNLVYGQVHQSYQKHITKESNGFHNYPILITMINLKKAGVASRNIVIKKQDRRPQICSYFFYHQRT